MGSRIAVTVLFFVNGTLFASYFARLPAIQERIGLSEGELGVALVGGMIGLIAVQPAAAALAVRFGARPVILAGGLGYCATIVLPGAAGSLIALFAAGGLIGLSNGALDVTSNTVGVEVERDLQRPVLASFHAAFSFGALTGAAGGGVAAALDVDPFPHLAAVGTLAAVAVLAAVRVLTVARAGQAAPRRPGHVFAWPDRAVLPLGALAFCVLLSEGAVNDWAAVFLARVLDASGAVAATGLAVFSITMAFGRLVGDRLTAALGPVRHTRFAALVGLAGSLLVVVAPGVPVALAGLVLLGAGLAATFPIAIRAAARHGEPATSIAAVSTLGYGAFVTGPPLIGGLAEVAGLRAALALLLVLGVATVVLAPRSA